MIINNIKYEKQANIKKINIKTCKQKYLSYFKVSWYSNIDS